MTDSLHKRLEGLVFPDLDTALATLPKEEREKYEAAQQSVIDARRSANRIEGQIWIT